MAKKTSAASKGYRKTTKKKPFLTKKEIIALIAIVAAIVLVVVLFNLLYNPYIDTKDIQSNDIISNAGARVRDRYVRLGSVTDLDGYTHESTVSPDMPNGNHTYTPTDAADPLDHFSVTGAAVTPASMLNSIASYYQPYTTTMSDVIETEVDGHTAYICAISLAYYDAEKDAETEAVEPEATDEAPAETEAAEPEATDEAPAETEGGEADAAAEEEHEPNSFHQNISMYIAADDTHSIGVNAYLEGEDESFYLPDDQIEAYMLKLAETVVFPEK